MAFLLLLPVGVFAQMLHIHLSKGGELRERGERQASSFVDLPATRGSVYDQAGRALVVNTARYEVALDPTVEGFDERADEFYTVIGQLTDRPASFYRNRTEQRASRQYVLLVRSLDEAAKEELESAEIPGLLLTGSFARRYNYGRTAGHVLGHVDTDLQGQAGLELLYDEYLDGEPGRQAVQRDRRGVVKALVGGPIEEPRHGESLTLTIDLVRQAILEEELARGITAADASWGTAIAMDPRTGAILAMANAPDYDPNNPGAFSDAAQRNHAITDHIEPGSTFKLVASVAAVESGLISPEDSVDTGQGWAVFRGRTMRDSHGYGRIPFGEAIVKSSNVGIARTADRMDPGTFYQYARALGFGQPTLIDLPGEVVGSLKRPETWSSLTLPWMSTGYEIEATPLQILAAYGALANGGLLVHPYVVAERRDIQGRVTWRAEQDSIRRAFDPETAERLTPWFERVVSEEGTGRQAAVEGLRIAGKTGTAQTATGGGYERRYRASFVGFFPADNPEVVMIVVVNNPSNGSYGGAVAAPIFSAIARRWIGTFPSIAAQVAPADPLPNRTEARVPNVQGMPGVVAAATLRTDGFPVRLAQDAAWQIVSAQRPGPGDTTRIRTSIRLSAELPNRQEGRRTGLVTPASDEPVATALMPDLTGQPSRHAVAWLASLGVQARLHGTGVVLQQTPHAGSQLPTHAVLTLR